MNSAFQLRIAFSEDFLEVRGTDGRTPPAPAYDLLTTALRDAAEAFGGSAYASDGDSYLIDCEGIQGALSAIVVTLTRAGYAVRIVAVDYCLVDPANPSSESHRGCPLCSGTRWLERGNSSEDPG